LTFSTTDVRFSENNKLKLTVFAVMLRHKAKHLALVVKNLQDEYNRFFASLRMTGSAIRRLKQKGDRL